MLKGEQALCARLARMPGAIRDASGEALQAVAEAALDEAKALVPVDTGRLRDSIAVRREGEAWIVSADCPYAAAVELGTARMSARPFLAPAAARQRAALPLEAAKRLERGL